MVICGLDENNDWNLNDIKRGTDAVNQAIKTRLQEEVGDCWFSVNAGLNIQLLPDLSVNDAKLYLDTNCRNIILQTEGVDSLLQFNSSINDARDTYNLTFKFVYNNNILEQEITLIA